MRNLKRRFYCKVTSEQGLSEHFNKFTLPWVFELPWGHGSLSAESNDFGFFNCPKDLDNAIKTMLSLLRSLGAKLLICPDVLLIVAL